MITIPPSSGTYFNKKWQTGVAVLDWDLPIFSTKRLQLQRH
jgi:hypothetical protein